MSSPPASNIVSFPAAPSDGSVATSSTPAPDSLLGQIQSLWRDRMSTAVAAGLDKLIDEFYNEAEHALERDVRDFWLKAKDAWPRQRRMIEETFKAQLVENFAPKPEETKTGAEFSSIESTWSELSLVDDSALEEDMRFTEIAGRIRGGADEELAQLDQRMAIVLGKESLKSEDNPLSPAALCAAFREALKDVELDLKVKIPVLRVFAESARPEANKLFREVNTLLKERGILPTIKYGTTKKPQTGAGPGAAGVRGDAPQVIGSVTLPIMSNPAAGAIGGMPMVAGMPLGVGAVSMPAGGGVAAAGAGLSIPGAMPTAGAGAAGDPSVSVGQGAAPVAAGTAGIGIALPGVGADSAADPFAMLQQLMLMNLNAVRGASGGAAVAGSPGPGAGVGTAPGFGGGAGIPGGTGPGAIGTPGFGVDGGASGPGVYPGGSLPGVSGIPGLPGGPANSGPGGAGGYPGGGYPGGGYPGGGGRSGFGHPQGTPGSSDGSGVPGAGGGAAGFGVGGVGGYESAGGPPGHMPDGGGSASGYPGSGGPVGGTYPGGVGGPGGARYPGGGGGATGPLGHAGEGSETGPLGYAGGGGPGGDAMGPGYGPHGAPGGVGAGTAGFGRGEGPGGSTGGTGGPGQGIGASGATGPGSAGSTGSGGGGGTGGTATTGFAGGAGQAPGGGGYGFAGAPGGGTGGAGVGSGATGPIGVGTGPHAPVVTPPGFAPAPSDGGGFPTLDPAIAQHATGQMPVGATGTGGYPILNMGGMGASGLIGSLTRLQQGDMGGLPDMPVEVRDWLSNAPPSATSNLPLPPRNVLQALKQTSLAQQFGQMDTVTLDIVAMLFDQIFGDPRVPPAMKALIGRLQIPMLKVAVLDKTFFSRKTHPARRMLDMLGELSLGLGDSFGLDNPLYRRIETSLSQLVEQFEEDFGVFDRMTEEYESMIAELNGQAVAVAKVEEKRIQDRERLEVARLFAQNELRTRIAGHQLPKAVLRFLSTDWMKLLILAYAKGGRESRAWHSLLETLDILVWSLTPKYTVDERKRLVSLLPGLLKRLAKGMEVVGTDSFMRERFNAVLMRCHSRTIAGGSAVGGPLPSRTNVPRSRPTAPLPVPATEASVAPGIDAGTPSVPAEIPLTPVTVMETPAPTAAVPAERDGAVDFVLDRTITPGLPSSIPFDLVPPAPPSDTGATQSIVSPVADDRSAPMELPVAIDSGEPLVPSFGAGASGPAGMTVEEVSFDGAAPMEMHDITAPMPEGPAAPLPVVEPPGSEPAVMQTGGAGPLQEEMLPAEVPAAFPTVTVKNPFGDGDIEVEEVSFNDLPGFASPMSTHVPPPPPDEYVTRVNAMKEGDWVEIHQEGKETVQARLSLVSPYRSTFVFSSRKGQKVAEYSLYQVTSYLRSGRLVLLEDVPLFDRAFGNLVNILRKGAESAA